MKDTFYFSHDYNARTDDKIRKLIRKHGMLGYGLFWAIVEDLYNNANALRTDYDCIAFELRTDCDIIKSIINDFDLFKIKDDFFGSLSVENRLNARDEKSLKASKSAHIRWGNNANALRTQSDGNAIKERKGKEIKENKKEKSLSPHEGAFDFSFQKNFYDEELKLNEGKSKINAYSSYIYYIFGHNEFKKPIQEILLMPYQLNFSDFLYLLESAKEKEKRIRDYIEILINTPGYAKGKQSVFLTLKGFIER